MQDKCKLIWRPDGAEREMNGSEADMSKIYTRDILHLAVCSGLRKAIILSLKTGKKSLGDLRGELEVSSTTAIHALRELEKNNITFQAKDKKYMLTKPGEIVALKLLDFSNAVEVLKKHERFWLEHDLSGIPEHLLEKIGWLKDSMVEKAPSTDFLKVYSTFIELLRNAEQIRGVASIFIPEYTLLFKDLILNKKTDIKLILTEEVLDKIDKETIKEISDSKNLKCELYIVKYDVKVEFIVTNNALSLGFFDRNGIYDWNNDLISYDQKAIAWGQELFEFYVKKAEKVPV